MFLWYKYLIVNLVFPISVFGVGIFFLIAPFPDLCLLVPFCLCWLPLSHKKDARLISVNILFLQKGRENNLEFCFRKEDIFIKMSADKISDCIRSLFSSTEPPNMRQK